MEKGEFEESKTRQEARDDEDVTFGTCGETRAWSSGPQLGDMKKRVKPNKKIMSTSHSNPLLPLNKIFCMLSLL